MYSKSFLSRKAYPCKLHKHGYDEENTISLRYVVCQNNVYKIKDFQDFGTGNKPLYLLTSAFFV